MSCVVPTPTGSSDLCRRNSDQLLGGDVYQRHVSMDSQTVRLEVNDPSDCSAQRHAATQLDVALIDQAAKA